MNKTFHDQLIATRDKNHSKNHPFFDLWAAGKLTKEQTAFYCTQHFHYVGEYLNWLAYEASQIPQRDVRHYLFENLGDEENPDDRHLDMLKDYVAASGVDRDSVETSIFCRARISCRTGDGGWSITNPGRPRWRACSSVWSPSSWIFVKRSCRRCTNTMATNRAPARSVFSKNIFMPMKFMAPKDSRSSRNIATTAELQALAIKQIEEATVRRWRYMNNIYWYALHGKVDDTPALPRSFFYD